MNYKGITVQIMNTKQEEMAEYKNTMACEDTEYVSRTFTEIPDNINMKIKLCTLGVLWQPASTPSLIAVTACIINFTSPSREFYPRKL